MSEVKRNYNLRKDDDVPPAAFLVVENLMFEVNQSKDHLQSQILFVTNNVGLFQ